MRQHLKSFPTQEKTLLPNSLETPHPDQNHDKAALPSANGKALNITPEEDILKGEIKTPLFCIYMSIAEITDWPCEEKEFY